MMTYQEARELRQRHQDALRRLTRMRKPELAGLLARQDRADGRVRLAGGPRTKDELVGELLDLDFPHAQLNEASHVLYHAPSARWEACEHCQARPDTLILNTSELVPGDVVMLHGMRVRLDEVREYAPVTWETGSYQPAWSCPGTVLNAADVIEQHLVPASFLQSYYYDDRSAIWCIEREDVWTVQGDALARWTVELPRPPVQR